MWLRHRVTNMAPEWGGYHYFVEKPIKSFLSLICTLQYPTTSWLFVDEVGVVATLEGFRRNVV
jgi:hypothetical protein